MTFRHLFFIIIITVITFIASASGSVAAVPDSTPSATTFIDKLKQIEVLKEKIATKVAQLRENDKGGGSGTIKSLGNSTLTLTTKNGEQTFSYSDDTVFFKMTDGSKSDALDASYAKKLKVGDQIAILGYYDSNHTTLAAKYIYVVTIPLHIIGKIADIDKGNFTITVKEAKGNTLIDIETYTKIYSYSKKTGLGRGGFSKLSENDAVHIFATPNPKEDRASAVKIITFAYGTTATPSATPTGK